VGGRGGDAFPELTGGNGLLGGGGSGDHIVVPGGGGSFDASPIFKAATAKS